MKSFRSLFTFLLALALTSAVASAQVLPPEPTSLVGDYHVTQMDGSPVAPGVHAYCDVFITGGVMYGVWRVISGGVTTYLPEETTQYELIGTNPLLYSWVNARGTIGLIGWNSASGQFESIVMTGPNAGTQRAWCPQ